MRGRVLTLSAAVVLLLSSACAPKSGAEHGAGHDQTLIGASLALSGSLASFGSFQQWGNQHAVAEANAAGGLLVDGKRRTVRLVRLDGKSDPNVASANVDTLISAALLGSCTPPLVIAASLAAERGATPMVSGCAPLVSVTGARQWTWAWDRFFNDPDLAEAPFRAWQDLGIVTNKRIVILHDNSADGTVVGARQRPAFAPISGYTVVANLDFPTDTTDFEASIARAKSSGADVLLVDAVTPQMVSIRRQLATAGYTPKGHPAGYSVYCASKSALLFRCSKASDFYTGHTLYADGGYTAG